MQILADFLPLLFFFAAYLYDDLYFAVAVLMLAMPVGLALKIFLTRKLDKMYLGSTIFLWVFGGATLLFRNPLFLYWKPTVFYWVVSVAFITSSWIGTKTLAERMFGKVVELSRQQWIKLNLMWAAFFIFAGGLNIYVAYSYSEAIWVNFKVFGLLTLTVIFGIVQAIWISIVSNKNDTTTENPKS